jgi:hypothetical protein
MIIQISLADLWEAGRGQKEPASITEAGSILERNGLII